MKERYVNDCRTGRYTLSIRSCALLYREDVPAQIVGVSCPLAAQDGALGVFVLGGREGERQEVRGIVKNPIQLMTRLQENPMSFKFVNVETNDMVKVNVKAFMTITLQKMECQED